MCDRLLHLRGSSRTGKLGAPTAHEHVGSKYVGVVLESLYVLESSMRYFFIRAEKGKNAGLAQVETQLDRAIKRRLVCIQPSYCFVAAWEGGSEQDPETLAVIQHFCVYQLMHNHVVANMLGCENEPPI
jgi:hypothetical protein